MLIFLSLIKNLLAYLLSCHENNVGLLNSEISQYVNLKKAIRQLRADFRLIPHSVFGSNKSQTRESM